MAFFVSQIEFYWNNNWLRMRKRSELMYYIKIDPYVAVPRYSAKHGLRYCFYRCFFPDFRLGPGTVMDTRRLSKNEREETLSVFEEHLPWRNVYIEGFKVLGTASYIFIFVPRDYTRRFIRLARRPDGPLCKIA